MTRLINDLTDLVNLRAGRPLMLNREQVDLVMLTRDVAREQQTALGRAITLEVETPSLPASVDVTRMERVLVNLLSNAAKYSPEGGDITLRLSQEGEAGADVAVLSVTDRGIGIPEDEIPRVFDRFYRASNIGGIAGTGVGLASAAQIVQQHGGSIDVVSGEGRGSTFTVRIPV
jgi:signal transduction histidine kinase